MKAAKVKYQTWPAMKGSPKIVIKLIHSSQAEKSSARFDWNRSYNMEKSPEKHEAISQNKLKKRVKRAWTTYKISYTNLNLKRLKSFDRK